MGRAVGGVVGRAGFFLVREPQIRLYIGRCDPNNYSDPGIRIVLLYIYNKNAIIVVMSCIVY